MRSKTLIVLSAFLASGPLVAASVPGNETDGVIKNLDLTTFPNSVGPRRVSGKTTFADYGFVSVEKTPGGANLVRDDKGWMMGFTIESSGPDNLRLCFYDRGLAKADDTRAPSYNATSALLVLKTSPGRWTAKQVPAGFARCQNNPPAA